MHMGYILAGAVLVLILVIGITLLTGNAKRHGRDRKRAAADSDYGRGVPGSDMAIVAEDRDAPLGDTTEHGRRAAGGNHRGRPGRRPLGRHGQSRRPQRCRDRRRRASQGRADVAPPTVGGEGEGRRRSQHLGRSSRNSRRTRADRESAGVRQSLVAGKSD